MEDMHVERIVIYAGENYLGKLEILKIEDIYKYMQKELIEKLSKLEHTILRWEKILLIPSEIVTIFTYF